MRTTLTLDNDVTVQLERLQRSRNASLKEIVNEALRRGLPDMSAPPTKRKAFRTRTFNMGTPLINLDNVAEALAYLEGEGFKRSCSTLIFSFTPPTPKQTSTRRAASGWMGS